MTAMDTRESVEALAATYDRKLASGTLHIRTAAMLRRMLDRAEAAEAALATVRADALREAADAIRGSIKVQLQIVDPHVVRLHAHERYRDVREIYAAAVENLIHTTTGET